MSRWVTLGDMSLFDLFKRFFEPHGRSDPFFGFVTQEDEDDDGDNGDFFHGPGHGFQSPFGPRSSPFDSPFDSLFRDFNELFADFGSMIREVPDLSGIEPPTQSPSASRSRSLRDYMLKYPDSHLPPDRTPSAQDPSDQDMPQPPRWLPWGNNRVQEEGPISAPTPDQRQDRILDSEVSSHGLDAIMRARRPASSSFFQSVSVSKVIQPDGTIEERRTVKDGEGNTTTTVTVTRGGQVVSSWTIDPSGRTDDL